MSGRAHSPEAWAEIETLFAGALELAGDERTAWLEEHASNPMVRAETLRLLRAHEAAEASGSFLAPLDPVSAAGLVRGADGADAVDDAPDVGERYRILRLLGRGGMGLVYLAHDERLGRRVALKFLPASLGADARARERFLAEARAASVLDHPRIATVHDVGETPDGELFIAMTYYEGVTLAERIAEGPLAIAEVADIARQIADGLAAAHAAGIVHRDVKPANVLVGPDGRVRVLDFGIARSGGAGLTREGVRLGTVTYMSPEQTRGDPVDARSDVWSFGALLFEMLSGRPPFRGPDDAVLIQAIRSDAAPAIGSLRPETPPSLAEIVERCLARDPDDRFVDAGAVAAALGAAGIAKEGSAARGGTRRWNVRPRWLAGAGLTVAVGAVGIAAILRPSDNGVDVRPALDPNRLVVLPFASASDDTALDRLGQDLGVTLSTGLDGLGELRTVDGSTVSARSVSWSGTGGLEPGLRLARELGAGRILHGRLLRAGAGDLVRADLVVYRTADGTTEIRVPVEAPAHDVAALTDSVTWALVRNLWPSNRAPPVPTNALASASLSGLRAFLEGEIATAEGRWREAPEHFAEAIETDSTFWLAYARYVEAMGYRDRAVPRNIRSRLEAHLDDLPPRERAILEVGMEADELPEYLAGLRELVERRPDSWRAWFRLADHVIHSALFAGATVDEARSAIERAVSLHPQSSTLWQHAFWMALAQRDTAATGVAIRELDRLHFDSATVAAVGLDQLAFYRYLHGLAAGGDGDEPEFVAWRRATADSLAAQLVRYSGPLDLSRISGSVSIYGSDRGEIALDRAVLRAPTGHAADAGALRALSQAWAGRGAWDSVMVALDRYVTDVDGVEPLRHAVRLVSVGRWLGALEPGAGAAWRAALERDAGRLDRRARAELAWLDGVAAFGARDGEGLDAARRRLEPDGAAATPEDGLLTSLLRSSLGAFQLALDGRTNAAADSLLAIERLRTNRFMFRRYGNARPYFTAINRLAAAEWLVENDRPAEAAPLLRWHEAVQFPADLAARADASLDGVILVWRGRAQAALGDPGRAREFYARALDELDAPSRELRPLVDAARRELDALGP